MEEVQEVTEPLSPEGVARIMAPDALSGAIVLLPCEVLKEVIARELG